MLIAQSMGPKFNKNCHTAFEIKKKKNKYNNIIFNV